MQKSIRRRLNSGGLLAAIVMLAAIASFLLSAGMLLPAAAYASTALTATPPLPTNTPNPTPANTVKPFDPASLDAWSFYDPVDPHRPTLISKSDNAFRLDPAWKVDRVEYIYKWWGYGIDPVFDYQVLQRDANDYRIGDKEIDPALVKQLVSAISGLQPTSSVLAGQDHTDDYPLWHLELTGQDGERIVLVSFSTANPGSAPWNVIYNGRIFTHYDGTLGAAIGNLFGNRSGEPLGTTFAGDRDPGTTIFSTTGLPAQISYGFVGLLPIADGFGYQIDREALELRGYIVGRLSVGGFGTMVIGNIIGLTSTEISVGDGKLVSCVVSSVSSNDPASVAWEFVCPLESAPLNSVYDYPVRITFGTDAGEEVSTEGRLQGKLTAEHTVLYVPPLEIQEILAAKSAAVADLLTDHVMIKARYEARWDNANGRMKLVSGEAILLGQATIGDRQIRYSVGTPFAIEDGQVAYWTLTRAALQKMIAQIAALPLTQRIYAQAPAVTLNLWYAEGGEVPDLGGYLLSSGAADYGISIPACGNIPAVEMPGNATLQAFGFGIGWGFWSPDFVLSGDQVVVTGLTLWPQDDTREGALLLLVPRQIDWGAGKSFKRIALGNWFGSPVISFSIDSPSDPETIAALRKIVEALPGKADFKDGAMWTLGEASIRVASDGSLEVVSCSAE